MLTTSGLTLDTMFLTTLFKVYHHLYNNNKIILLNNNNKIALTIVSVGVLAK